MTAAATRALHPAGSASARQAEIWSSFAEDWCGGFEVAAVERDGSGARYWMRRTSDGTVLPVPLDHEQVRLL